ncbi:MAG: tRNA pseudouridine(55) synthase TruB [Candidatus Scatovivens sp.]
MKVKLGHTGTLDPLAKGVLPVLLGKATKLSKYLIEHDKEYLATIKLGEKTNTGDLEGEIVEKKEVDKVIFENNNINNVIKTFEGEFYQQPPMYSAIKVNGKKLYEYAREGIEIEREKRKINIYDIELIEVDKINFEIKIKVKCSKGTYIRTLCEDISKSLGTVGYMKELIRTQVNKFDIKDTITLEELEGIENKEKKIITIEEYYKNYETNYEIDIEKDKLKLFLNGNVLKINLPDGIYRIYYNKEFVGTGSIKDQRLKRDLVI